MASFTREFDTSHGQSMSEGDSMAFLERSLALGSLLGAVMLLGLTARGALSGDREMMNGDREIAWHTSVSATGPVQPPTSEPNTGAGVCGGFSEEDRYDNLPVSWSFRLCEAAADQYDVQLRFRNRSDRPLRFQYRVWLAKPERCDADAGSDRLLIGGAKSLRPGQSEEWPYSSVAVPRADYRGRVWSCVTPEN
jgi:hypothetical protein